MCKIIFEVDSFEWGLIRTRERATVSEDELKKLLSELNEHENPLGVEATELRDYLDGRGQLLTRVALMGAKKQMDELLDRIAERSRRLHAPAEVLERAMVNPDYGDETVCHRAYTRAE